MTSETIQTSRLRTHYVGSGPEDGVPVVLVHGNLSTGRFYEHLFDEAPDRYRLIAPDMRGFGDSEPLPIDATRGLADWADDTQALIEALGIDRPVHLVGWSTGGAAIAAFALDRDVASLTFIDPVSPYGYGGTHADDTPCFPDWAGTGGGAGAPENWPGEELFPPQPMVWQIRSVLQRYRDAGGRADMARFEGSGHFPTIDAAEQWGATFFAFLESVS